MERNRARRGIAWGAVAEEGGGGAGREGTPQNAVKTMVFRQIRLQNCPKACKIQGFVHFVLEVGLPKWLQNRRLEGQFLVVSWMKRCFLRIDCLIIRLAYFFRSSALASAISRSDSEGLGAASWAPEIGAKTLVSSRGDHHWPPPSVEVALGDLDLFATPPSPHLSTKY